MRACVLAAAALAAAQQQPTIFPFGANSFRIQYSPPGLPIVNSTYTPFLPAPLSSSPFSVSTDQLTYTNGNLQVSVDPATGFFTATRLSDGFVVQKMTNLTFGPPAARGRYPTSQLQLLGHAQGETLVGMGEQGLTGRVTLEQPFYRDFIESEYYGYNSGRQAFMPQYFSSAGYGFVLAQPGYGWLRVDVAPYESAYNASSSATIDLWITTTPGTPVYSAAAPHPLLALLKQSADALGYAPPMPFFASGFIASKDRYRNQSQFLAVAHGYVDRGIPISMLTVDVRWRAPVTRLQCLRPSIPHAHTHMRTPTSFHRSGSTGKIWATCPSTLTAGQTRRPWWMSSRAWALRP